MAFKDLLNKPLPSKYASIREYFRENGLDDTDLEDDITASVNAGDINPNTDVLKNLKDNDDEDDDDEDDDDEDDDDEDDDDECEDGECEEAEMTPEESEEADRIIDMAATPLIVKDMLEEKEIKEFVEGLDFEVACNEGFLMESDASKLLGAKSNYFAEAKMYNKTKVQMSLKDRFSQLFEISVLGCARAKNDPDYIKLVKIQKARRVLKARLRQKYRNPALQKAKMYLQRLKKSNSAALAKAAKKMTK